MAQVEDALLKLFGKDLRKVRDAGGKTQEQVADLIGVSTNTLGRWEGGQVRPNPGNFRDLLKALGVDGSERDRLTSDYKRIRQETWVDHYQNELSPGYRTFISHENIATVTRNWSTTRIPGLLQTEAYTRATIGDLAPGTGRTQVERLVAVRRERQRVLTKTDPLKLIAVIGEGVLHRLVGGPPVMVEQLLALTTAPPHVTVQMLPFAAGATPGSFIIFDRTVVCVESATTNIFLYDGEEHGEVVATYMETFDRISNRALSPEDSVALITATARKVRTKSKR